jgi:hypothetical protein
VASRRWLRLAPRYLDRELQRLRVLRADRAFVTVFRDRLRKAINSHEISVAVEMEACYEGGTEIYRLPAAAAPSS